MFQVKPARAGSSIGVTVAYGLADSLVKANAIITEVVLFLTFIFFSPLLSQMFWENLICMHEVGTCWLGDDFGRCWTCN